MVRSLARSLGDTLFLLALQALPYTVNDDLSISHCTLAITNDRLRVRALDGMMHNNTSSCNDEFALRRLAIPKLRRDTMIVSTPRKTFRSGHNLRVFKVSRSGPMPFIYR